MARLPNALSLVAALLLISTLLAMILLRKARLRTRLLVLRVLTYALVAIVAFAATVALTSPSEESFRLLVTALALPVALWVMVYKVWMD